jgi:orotate phosphoribosyltransferase
MSESLIGSVPARRGHFVLESGHHSDLWLDLELLFLHPKLIEQSVARLSEMVRPLSPEAVCGPLVEGAFVALMVASRLDVEFCYAERFETEQAEGDLFPIEYRVPHSLREQLRGKRVAIVNDVISAGSAVRGTYFDLLACGAEPIALGALLVLGDPTGRFVEQVGIPLISVGRHPFDLWTPSECPLCAAGTTLEGA